MKVFHTSGLFAAAILCTFSTSGCARQTVTPDSKHATQSWTFAVSGDSRNCGNMVMPAIAADARKQHAAFYWHLGDLRAIYKVDEDYARERRFKAFLPPPSIGDYQMTAWSDFTQHQVQAFGDMPFYIGIGNHETIAPRTTSQFMIEFQPLLDRQELKDQRAKDEYLYTALKQTPAARTWYHWVERGVDFINLDNASDDSFDVTQLAWFNAVVDADLTNPAIKTLVVGMHESLPYSKSDSHSMCSSTSGRESGLRVYSKLAEAQKSRNVYLLASHSHFYLANAFDTEHWRDPQNGGVVLPGWVIGTAGAERYPLPAEVAQGPDAREHVYGYLTGTVSTDGKIRFDFHEFSEADLQAARGADYSAEDVAFCFANNPEIERLNARRPKGVTCEAAQWH